MVRGIIPILIFIAVFLAFYYSLPDEKLWMMVFIAPISYWIIQFINGYLIQGSIEKKDEESNYDHELPWYLKEKVLFMICIILPPIAYFIVLRNLRRLEYEHKIRLLTFTTIIVSLWLLRFLPDEWELYVWAFMLAIIIGNNILKVIKH